MRKIIKGRMYDTETAEEIASAYSRANRGDFRWFEETLYRKKTGEFFLYGEGGPLTKYAEVGENGREKWSGEKFIPLDIEEAKRWCEKEIDVSEYIELFGEVEE